MKDRIKQHEPVVYLDLQPAHGVTAEDVLGHCRTLQAVSRRAYHDSRREVVDRIEYFPSGRPRRFRIVFADDATSQDVATLRVTLEPYSDTEPALRRGHVGTVSLKEATA